MISVCTHTCTSWCSYGCQAVINSVYCFLLCAVANHYCTSDSRSSGSHLHTSNVHRVRHALWTHCVTVGDVNNLDCRGVAWTHKAWHKAMPLKIFCPSPALRLLPVKRYAFRWTFGTSFFGMIIEIIAEPCISEVLDAFRFQVFNQGEPPCGPNPLSHA